MSNNKLYTLGYFKKRLIDSGFSVKVLIPKFYNPTDNRKWLISIMNNKNWPILCECIIEKTPKFIHDFDKAEFINVSEYKFKVYGKFRTELINTESMLVINNKLKQMFDEI